MRALPALAAVVLLLAAGPADARDESAAPELRPGALLSSGPPLLVQNLKGERVDLRAGLAVTDDQERRLTLLVFWGTWCAPCVQEIPVLNELHRFYAGKGLRIVGVGLDMAGDTREKVAEAAVKHGITYPVLFDVAGEARRFFGLRAVPAAALVDAAGRLTWVGQKLPSDLSSRIRSALVPGGDGAAK